MHELARFVIRTLTISTEVVGTQEAFRCAGCELPTPLQGVEDALNDGGIEVAAIKCRIRGT